MSARATFDYETFHPIKRALSARDWKLCLGDLLEEAGLSRSATKGFKLVEGPTWCDRDSNNPSHGVDYYDTKVEGPAKIVAKLEEVQGND